MRKQLLLVGFLIAIATQSLAQGVTVQNANPTSSIANRGSYIADSIFRLGTRDTVKPAWWNPSWSFNGAFQLGLDGNPYYYYGGKWNGFAGGSGGSGTVTSITQGYGMVLTPSPITTSGSVRVDTAAVSTKANVVALTVGKVNYTDTAAMLSPYLRDSDTAAMLANYATEASLADTALALRALFPTSIDTTSLSNRIDARVKYTDTASMLSPYARTSSLPSIAGKVNYTDTSSMLTPYLRKADTTSMLSPYLRSNLGVKYTDTSSMLSPYQRSAALPASTYLDQSGSKIYATTGGVANTYTLTLTPAITSYVTGQTFKVIFNLANTGASTININGLGAKSLIKDASTALVSGDLIASKVYILFYNGTNFQVVNVGGLISGTGGQAYTTSPTFTTPNIGAATATTSIVGDATFSAFNTVTTNLSLGGAATTMTIGGTPTTAITHTYSGNATANTITKTLNFGTGGASGSTTAINIGSATSGATTNTKLNITPASDATGDLWYRNASGFMTRLGIGTAGQVLTVAAGLPSWAAAGGGSGWGLTGNTGLSSTANWVGNNDDISFNLKVNNVFSGEIAPSAYGRTHFGYNAGTGAKSALSFYTTLIGSNAGPSITGNGNTGVGEATFDNGGALTNSVAIGRKAATILNSGDNNVAIGYFTGLPSTSGSHQLNIQNVIWGVSCNGIYTSPTTPAGRIGIGTNAPNAGSILELSSTTQGFLPTRMTGTQAAAITPKEEGLMVYVKDATGGFAAKGWYGWNGAAWEKLNP